MKHTQMYHITEIVFSKKIYAQLTAKSKIKFDRHIPTDLWLDFTVKLGSKNLLEDSLDTHYYLTANLFFFRWNTNIKVKNQNYYFIYFFSLI